MHGRSGRGTVGRGTEGGQGAERRRKRLQVREMRMGRWGRVAGAGVVDCCRATGQSGSEPVGGPAEVLGLAGSLAPDMPSDAAHEGTARVRRGPILASRLCNRLAQAHYRVDASPCAPFGGRHGISSSALYR